MRVLTSELVICVSEALNWGEAAVVSIVRPSACEELARHSLRKLTWAKLLLPIEKTWERSRGWLFPEFELPDGATCYSAGDFGLKLAIQTAL